MGKDSIGVSMGDSSHDELAEFMDESQDNNGVFFSMEYDMAAQMAMQEQLEKTMGGIDSDDPDYRQYMELQEKLMDSYKAWLGRSRVEVSFQDDGVHMDTIMTFK